MFELHERLAADTALIRPLTLSQVLLMNNRAWPWLILVPARPGLRELHHLAPADRTTLIEEIAGVSAAVERLYPCDKLNVAAIGNIVPQLHIHVVARREGDPGWPNPVWGSGLGEPYAPEALDAEVLRLRDALKPLALTDTAREPFRG